MVKFVKQQSRKSIMLCIELLKKCNCELKTCQVLLAQLWQAS